MEIIRATEKDLDKIGEITMATIKAVYPKFYPQGAVAYFLAHHSLEEIRKDLEENVIYVAYDNDVLVGTGTLKGNEIYRLFVLPEYQNRGFGTEFMDFLEGKASLVYSFTTLDASFPAFSLYQKRGYKTETYKEIVTANGDILCYHTMKKYL